MKKPKSDLKPMYEYVAPEPRFQEFALPPEAMCAIHRFAGHAVRREMSLSRRVRNRIVFFVRALNPHQRFEQRLSAMLHLLEGAHPFNEVSFVSDGAGCLVFYAHTTGEIPKIPLFVEFFRGKWRTASRVVVELDPKQGVRQASRKIRQAILKSDANK